MDDAFTFFIVFCLGWVLGPYLDRVWVWCLRRTFGVERASQGRRR